MKIFVITIERAKERQAFMQQRMQQLGLEFEFFYGVDGTKLSQEELNQVDYDYCKNKFGHSINLGEIGCALSHIRLYEKIKKEKIAQALILEDDAYLFSTTPEIIKSLPGNNKHELIYLFHGKAKKHLFKKSLPHNYKLVKYRRPSKNSKRGIVSTTAYVINQQGINKLLNMAYPVRMPSDYLTGYIQTNSVAAYGVEPCCVDPGHFESSIPGRTYGQHINNL